MKNRLIHWFISLFVISGIFTACETDIDIYDDWKEITVVYGILNQNDSIHYIKINKAFLGEGDALMMATIPDSTIYGDELEVFVEEWKNGSMQRFFQLDTSIITNKAPGIFTNPETVVYSFKAQLDEDASYKLVIENTESGKVVSSETPLVGSFSIERPNPLQMISFVNTNPYEIVWSAAKTGRYYQLVVRFNYLEENINNPGVYTNKHVDWLVGSRLAENIDGSTEWLKLEIMGDNFYQNLRNNIEVNPDLRRYEGKVEFIFTVAGDELKTYMDVNEPNTSIVQTRPDYTNINNGIGIFSCRYDNTIDNPRILNLSIRSADSLRNGRFTNTLGFYPPIGP